MKALSLRGLLCCALLLPSSLLLGQTFTFRDLPFMAQNSGGLTVGLVAAWNFDEQFDAPTNRFSDFGGMVWTNVGGLTGAERSLTSGGINITNSGAGYLNLTNSGSFGLNSSFTMAFWVIGGNSGSNPNGVGQQIDNTTYDYHWDASGVFTVKNSGGSPIQVNGTANTTAGLFVVCGYDADNGVIFISNNGGAKSTTACGSIKQTANMPFRLNTNPSVTDNFYFWNRVLSASEITTLYNGGYGMQYPFSQTSVGAQVANSYSWAVINTGGTVSANSISAVTQLANTLNSAGLLNRLSCAVPFCPDSLQAALTSLKTAWQINGGNSFIASKIEPYRKQVNFVLGDLSVNGLTGNGSSKYVNLFVSNPAGGLRDVLPNPLDAGFVTYVYTMNSPASFNGEHGYYDSGASPQNLVVLQSHNGQPVLQASLGGIASGVTNSALANGFYSIQRSSNTVLDGYFANSLTPHARFDENTTASGVSSWRADTQPYALFNYWDAVGGGPGVSYSSDTLSFFAFFNLHLSSSESATVSSALTTFRTTLGGGVR